MLVILAKSFYVLLHYDHSEHAAGKHKDQQYDAETDRAQQSQRLIDYGFILLRRARDGRLRFSRSGLFMGQVVFHGCHSFTSNIERANQTCSDIELPPSDPL